MIYDAWSLAENEMMVWDEYEAWVIKRKKKSSFNDGEKDLSKGRRT